ncbi:MAG: GtrA family protein [Clostridia bacterium]|nr:GtrA family protein [Clostridia bacterium]
MAMDKKEVMRAVKFTLFSASAGLIQIGSYALFFEVFHWTHWVAYLVSLVLSVLWNFTFNRRYTFRSDCDIKRAMLLVAAYYIVFTPLTTWAGKLLTDAGVNNWIVEVGTMLLNFITEFLYQRFVVYKDNVDTNSLADGEKKSEE